MTPSSRRWTLARPKRVAEVIPEVMEPLEEGDLDERVEVLLEKLENIQNADECRQVIATSARYRLMKLISGPEEKTFREAALGALKAIEVSVRTGAGSQLTAAAEAITKMAENEEEERESKRKRRQRAAKRAAREAEDE